MSNQPNPPSPAAQEAFEKVWNDTISYSGVRAEMKDWVNDWWLIAWQQSERRGRIAGLREAATEIQHEALPEPRSPMEQWYKVQLAILTKFLCHRAATLEASPDAS